MVLIGLGVTILDFSADSCDSPVRAFLLDECNSKDQDSGLNIHAFLGGVGASFGYLLTSIEWEKTFLVKILGIFGVTLEHRLRIVCFVIVSFHYRRMQKRQRNANFVRAGVDHILRLFDHNHELGAREAVQEASSARAVEAHTTCA